MELSTFTKQFDFTGRSFVMTGGTGVLGATMVEGLVGCGARVALVGRNMDKINKLKTQLGPHGDRVLAVEADVMDRPALERGCEKILSAWKKIDGLINGAGGNNPRATSNAENTFFRIPEDAFRTVIDLNLLGTVLPSQVFGAQFAAQKEGVILNVSSMNAFRPLTRIAAYSASKAAVSNFTQWFAVYMAQEFSPSIRVNALAPGFFLTEQNRFLLTDEKTGEPTARGKKILEHTPAGRYGRPEELLGGMLWLLSPAAQFVTGIVVPIDGGFSAFSGV